jgi:hypothetical protein
MPRGKLIGSKELRGVPSAAGGRREDEGVEDRVGQKSMPTRASRDSDLSVSDLRASTTQRGLLTGAIAAKDAADIALPAEVVLQRRQAPTSEERELERTNRSEPQLGEDRGKLEALAAVATPRQECRIS